MVHSEQDVLTGTVVTGDGWPVPHGVVTIIDQSGAQCGRGPVGPDGRFTVAGPGPGTYTVLTSAAGYVPRAWSRRFNGTGSVDLGRFVLTRSSATALPAVGTWVIDPVHSSISAAAVHLGFAVIRGRFREFTGTLTVADPLENSTVQVCIETASIDTGNPDRDAHLRSADFLDVAAFPHIRYTGRRVLVPHPDPRRSGWWQLDGVLTMKDVSRPVPFDVSYLGTGDGLQGETRAGFQASTQLDRDEFGIIWNQSLMAGSLAVGRTLRVSIDLEAVFDHS